MPLSVFGLRNLRAANLVIFLLYGAIFGFWFFQSLYMQGTLGYSALETGLAFVPMTLAVGIGATLAPRLARRFGARMVLAAGMLSATAGEALLIGVHPDGSYLANVLPGGLFGAFGLGLALVPATIVAVEGVPRAVSGLASGVLNTSRFIGAALGLAVLSTLAAHHTDAEIGTGTSAAKALTDGFAAPVRRRRGVLPGRRDRRGRPAAPAAQRRSVARRRSPAPSGPSRVRRAGAVSGRTSRLDFPRLMRFYEFESRRIVERAGIPVTEYGFCKTAAEAREAAERIGGPTVIKSQVLTGGRMKAGGVKFADTPEEAEAHATEILELEINGHMPVGVLVDPKAEVEQEYYAAVLWDGRAKRPMMLFSDMGGIDIEEVAENHPDHVGRGHLSNLHPIPDFRAKEVVAAGRH